MSGFPFFRASPIVATSPLGVTLHPRSRLPDPGPYLTFSLGDVTAFEVFKTEDSPGFDFYELSAWFGPNRMEVVCDRQGMPCRFPLLSDAMLAVRRLGWYGIVDCTLVPY